jgi:hypothetical protein
MESHLELAFLIAHKKDDHPGESRDPLFNQLAGRRVDPACVGKTLQLCSLPGIAEAAFRKREDVKLSANKRFRRAG